MSYEKQTWVTGETITAEKLNHMEDGIGSGDSDIVIVHYNDMTQECDYTFEQLVELLSSNKTMIAKVIYDGKGSIVTITLPTMHVREINTGGGSMQIVQIEFYAMMGRVVSEAINGIEAYNLTFYDGGVTFNQGYQNFLN